jgi:hypothetical protein
MRSVRHRRGAFVAPVGAALMALVIVWPAFAGTVTFGAGTKRVGTNIPAGTYRTHSAPSNCYWERLKGFSGKLNDIIANDFSSGFQVVTIKSTDKGFNSSRCGTWSSNLSRVTSSLTKFGQGTLIVGTDITPGTYRSSNGADCYWARLRNFSGQLAGIIANNFGGAAIVSIRSSDAGFESSKCGTWTKI